MKKFKKYSLGDKVFYIVITVILTLFFLLVLYPIIFVVSASFSSGGAVQSGRVYLWPVEFSLKGYEMVFRNKEVWLGFRNSIFYTVAGTMINIILTMTCGYCLSRRDVPGRKGIMMIFTFTMFFGGGMIPTYILIRSLHMLNTIWVMLIPGAMGVYNMIVAKTFIQSSIPDELLEATQMDGGSDIMYYLAVVLPLSKAIIAVLVLFYGVGHWNSYFNAMIYLFDEKLYPLTMFLREILMADRIDTEMMDPELASTISQYVGVIKYALIVVTMVPIILLYPFVQKHFVKGVMIGSVKG